MSPINHHNESAMALIAHKIAPFQFDIGYGAASASIRDQIVRAQLFIRAALAAGLIHAEQRVNATHPLLICGAGVAGLAAAMEAARLGVYFILIDKKKAFPSGALAGGGNRYISPTMYEWPSSVTDEHAHPLVSVKFLASHVPTANYTFNFGKPVQSNKFASQVNTLVKNHCKKWLSAATSRSITESWYLPFTEISAAGKIVLKATLNAGSAIKSLPLISLKTPRDEEEGPFQFSCILFAAGFSEESQLFCGQKIPTAPFWSPDKLLTKNLGATVTKPSVLVVGGGDGAIQDAIRALVVPNKIKHPTELWNYLANGAPPANVQPVNIPFIPSLNAPKTVDELYQRILTVEMYSSVAYAWVPNKEIYKDIDTIYMELAEQYIILHPVVLQKVASILRKDVKDVNVATLGGFSRAYALNRFLIHLLVKARECLPSLVLPGISIIKSGSNKFVPSMTDPAAGQVHFEDGTKRYFDLIVVRAGAIDRVFQAIGISGIDPARVEFGRLPVPLMAPNTSK